MDPLTALGLVGNIITFIDFSTKLFKRASEIYQASESLILDKEYRFPAPDSDRGWEPMSGRQLLEEQLNGFIFTTRIISEGASKKSTQTTFEINEIVLNNNLQRFVGYSKTLSQSDGLRRPPDASTTTVESVAEASNFIARKMIERLENMRKTAKGKIWSSLKLAMRDLLKESEIKEMQEALNMYQGNLMLLVVVSLRENLDLQYNRQQDQFDSLKTSMRDTLHELMEKHMAFGTKKAFSSGDAAQSLPKVSDGLNEQQKNGSQKTMDLINQALKDHALEPLPDLSVLRQRGVISEAAKKLSSELFSQEKALLLSLRYQAMEDREERVSGAQASFEWIFHDPKPGDPPWSNFSEWLTGKDDSLYWITGKAGSGKSTLMKHIFHEPRTRQALLRWANPAPLAVAVFFFWRTGTPMQKTEEGLLRSLIYQILYKHRELIPVLFPNVDSSQGQFSADTWTIHTLRRVFQALARQKAVALKICFFIDGLDEYDDTSTPTDIVDLVNDLASVDNIKICASSRPLPDFEYSFQTRPSLMLQNLTFNDIRAYVTNKFNENAHVAQIQRIEPGLSNQLSSEIVDKASGVFLWVKLAVHSILIGLRNEDNSSELYRRLRELPDDLMKLYSHMLSSVESSYQVQGAKLLQIVYQAHKPFTILELAIVDMLLNEPRGADGAEPDHWSKSKQQEKCIRMDKRLKVACLGLLEVVPAHSDTYIGITRRPVQFMHHSVADFLETEIARRHMEKTTTPHPFSPYLTLMEATLFALKYLDTDLLPVRQPSTYLAEAWYSEAWFFIRVFMKYAVIQERTHNQAQVQLVDRMDSEAARLADLFLQLDRTPNIPPHVAAQLHWSERRREEFHKVQLYGSSVSFALESGLHLYVDAKLKSESSLKKGRKLTSKQAKFALAIKQAYANKREIPSDLRERVRNELESAARFRINDWSFGLRNRKFETSKTISQAVDQLDRFKGQPGQDQDRIVNIETEGAGIVSRTAFPDIGIGGSGPRV